MLLFGRLGLLLWKNFKLKIRHPWITLSEIFIPCFFAAILVVVRAVIHFERISDPTIYYPFPIENEEIRDRMIIYSPNDTETNEMMKIMSSITANMTVKGFGSEKEMLDYFIEKDSDYILCGIVLSHIKKNETLDYKLRFPFAPKLMTEKFDMQQMQEFTWKTSQKFPLFQTPGPRSRDVEVGGPPGYYQNGFLYVQHYLTRAFAFYHNPEMAKDFYNNLRLNVQRLPYPPYDNDVFMYSLQFMFPLIMMISFNYPSVNLTKNIVREKESRLKEAMKMMGLKDWMHWSSWFIDSFIWSMISIVLITILFCTNFKADYGIINKSNPLLVLIFFSLYLASSISFCFMLSSFFTNANIAGIVAGAAYFLSFLPYFQVSLNYFELTFTMKTLICLLFNTNMALGCMLLSAWESNHIGLQWSNLMEPASLDDNFSFLNIFIMFIVDTLIYLLAAFYISNVFPGRYGVPNKWYYFIQKSYWFNHKEKTDEFELTTNKLGKFSDKKTIQLVNLSKSYDGGKIKALDDMNLIMNEDEITVLLGHNGAGKTTLMSILCGLLPPSSGSILIDGQFSEYNIEEIRNSLGVCPQFDILFNHLTVKEHLWFYCKLKNVADEKINDQINQMIKLLDFEDKRNNQAHTLSGGMKRKLSVGIALIGGSKFILLDEATSGMDVSARRFIWDLLIQEKKGRTILLSTHFMEEADVLGDQIAIIERGRLKCYGSPIELKKNYGLGYLLSFAVKEETSNVHKLFELIKSQINNSRILTSIGSEITFSLPETESHKFEKLFLTIEQNREKIGILNYGISVTTLEEVFLRVGDFSKEGTKQMNSFYEKEKNSVGVNIEKSAIEKIKHNSLKVNKGTNHLIQIYYSLFVKKILFVFRNKFSLLAQFLLPGVLLAASILINRNQMNKSISSPSLLLNLGEFKKINTTSFFDSSNTSADLSKIYHDLLSKATGNSITNEAKYDNLTNDKVVNYFIDFAKGHEGQYNMYYLISAVFQKDEDGKMFIRAMFNNQAYHASSISVSYIDQTILRYITGNDGFNLLVWNDPFPRKNTDAMKAISFDSSVDLQLCNNIQFAMSFLLSSFIIFLVKEKSTNFKHIQRISGLQMFHYWLSNFIIDFIIYLFSSLVLCLIIYLLDVDRLTSFDQQAHLFLIFACHGAASLPIVYLFSNYFRDAATAYVRFSLYLVVIGTTTFLVVMILQIPDLDLVHVSEIFDYIYTFIFPIYDIAISVFYLHQNYLGLDLCFSDFSHPLFRNQTINIQELCEIAYPLMGQLKICCPGKCDKDPTINYLCLSFNKNKFAWDKLGIGKNLAGFLIQAIVAWALLSMIESKSMLKLSQLFTKNRKIQEEISNDDSESDVEAERDRLRRRSYFTLSQTDSMIATNVRKNYGSFPAVRNVTFGVKKGECFGILGENGAGKTTMFKMITGDEDITSGDIVINGHSVKNDMGLVYKDIGYCPQFDGLIDHLTGRETLKIISRIRGINENFLDEQIDALSELLFFQQHIDQQVHSYSGGTKRKLSFAISIVGNPLIAFLDEPTTGVDPVSRRCLWNAVHMVRTAGSSLVLTSHSMEECEALCNRLMIMVHGKITCLGSPMHLKQKYGAGYIVHIKLSIPDHNSSELYHKLDTFMRLNFPHSCRDAVHNNSLSYRIQTNQVGLGSLFGKIEKSKKDLNIEDYSISQTSLERIFLSFVRKPNKF